MKRKHVISLNSLVNYRLENEWVHLGSPGTHICGWNCSRTSCVMLHLLFHGFRALAAGWLRREIQTPKAGSHITEHVLGAGHQARGFSVLSPSCLATLRSRQIYAHFQMRKRRPREGRGHLPKSMYLVRARDRN